MLSGRFDTLAIARELQEVGFEAQQAESLVNAMSQERRDYVTTEKLEDKLDAALASLLNKIMLSQIAIAGALFAALRLFGGA